MCGHFPSDLSYRPRVRVSRASEARGPSPIPQAARSQVKLHPSIVQPVNVLGAPVTIVSSAQRQRSSDGRTRGKRMAPHDDTITVACQGLWHVGLHGNHPGTCWQLPSGRESGREPCVRRNLLRDPCVVPGLQLGDSCISGMHDRGVAGDWMFTLDCTPKARLKGLWHKILYYSWLAKQSCSGLLRQEQRSPSFKTFLHNKERSAGISRMGSDKLQVFGVCPL